MSLDKEYFDEIKNYLFNEIKNNDLMREKCKKTCKYFNYFSIVTDCVSISALASLVCVPVGITSFEGGIKICAIFAGIK